MTVIRILTALDFWLPAEQGKQDSAANPRDDRSSRMVHTVGEEY